MTYTLTATSEALPGEPTGMSDVTGKRLFSPAMVQTARSGLLTGLFDPFVKKM